MNDQIKHSIYRDTISGRSLQYKQLSYYDNFLHFTCFTIFFQVHCVFSLGLSISDIVSTSQSLTDLQSYTNTNTDGKTLGEGLNNSVMLIG